MPREVVVPSRPGRGPLRLRARLSEPDRLRPPLRPDPADPLECAIASHTATVGVVGQGYVGFGLAQRAATVGFRTFGVDIDPVAVRRCVAQNAAGKPYDATADAAVLGGCDVILIAVPTPTRVEDGSRRSDLSLVTAAAEVVASQIATDDRPRLIVSESTYAPGTTRNVVMPILAPRGSASEVAVGYSPERIDPGNQRFELEQIPKVTSGADDRAAALTLRFYREIVDDVVPASSMEAAEATKLLENTFRFVNIAFAQEFDEYCHARNLNSHEVTRLAATKPFGFMPFFAGAGVGGHCIAEDPYFLHDSMREGDVAAPVLAAAMANHESRASVVVQRIAERLEGGLEGARVLLLGVTYKPEIGDTRRSPALAIMGLLEQAGARVDFHDPYVSEFAGRSSVNLASADPAAYDLAVMLVDHRAFDAEAMASRGWRTLRLTDGATGGPASAPRSAAGGKGRR